MVDVWLVELEQSAAALEAEERRRPRLSADDLERITALASIEQRRQRRASAIALRALIAAFLGNDRFDRVPFARMPGGKPMLPGIPVSFSVSHAAGRALVALAPGAPIGVDVERQRALRMSPLRQAALIGVADTLPLAASAAANGIGADAAMGIESARVLRAWVRLEALAKQDGIGIGRLLTEAGVLGRRPQADHSQADSTSSSAPPRMHASDRARMLPMPMTETGWPARYTRAGVTIHDLDLPADAAGAHWYAALAAPAAALGPHGPRMHTFPVDPTAVARLSL